MKIRFTLLLIPLIIGILFLFSCGLPHDVFLDDDILQVSYTNNNKHIDYAELTVDLTSGIIYPIMELRFFYKLSGDEEYGDYHDLKEIQKNNTPFTISSIFTEKDYYNFSFSFNEESKKFKVTFNENKNEYESDAINGTNEKKYIHLFVVLYAEDADSSDKLPPLYIGFVDLGNNG